MNDRVEVSFDRFRVADRIEVRTNANSFVREANDRERVLQICDWLDALSDDWTLPAGGVPVASTRLDFYDGDRFVGNVGLAYDFLTVHVGGGFATYGLDDEGRIEEQLRRIAGLDPKRPRNRSVVDGGELSELLDAMARVDEADGA